MHGFAAVCWVVSVYNARRMGNTAQLADGRFLLNVYANRVGDLPIDGQDQIRLAASTEG